MGLIVSIIIGIAAGWIAEQAMKRDHGLITNLAVGAVGGLLGGLIITIIGMEPPAGFIARLATASGGAILFLFLLDKFRRRA